MKITPEVEAVICRVKSSINISSVSRRSGISRPYISKILSGDKVCSLKMAIRLEAATGFDRLFWLDPMNRDEHGRTLVDGHRKVQDSIFCPYCKRRVL